VLARLERERTTSGFSTSCNCARSNEDSTRKPFHYTRQTLGYADPLDRNDAGEGAVEGDVELPAESFLDRCGAKLGFHFDNGKVGAPGRTQALHNSRAPVTNSQFLEFVRDDGYQRRISGRPRAELEGPSWSRANWIERDGEWRSAASDEECRWTGDLPVMHVNCTRRTPFAAIRVGVWPNGRVEMAASSSRRRRR